MNSAKNNSLSSDKNLEAMWQFSQTYAKRTGTYFCAEPSVTAVVIEGLAKHKDDLGAPLCPCRHYEDCMLFLTTDNEFAGENQDIDLDYIKSVRDSMK